MKTFKNINNIRLVIYTIVLIVFIVWAYFSYLDIQNPAVSAQSVKVCVSDKQSNCPADAHFLACQSSLFQWADSICPQYNIESLRKDLLKGQCGTSLLAVTCL